MEQVLEVKISVEEEAIKHTHVANKAHIIYMYILELKMQFTNCNTLLETLIEKISAHI